MTYWDMVIGLPEVSVVTGDQVKCAFRVSQDIVRSVMVLGTGGA